MNKINSLTLSNIQSHKKSIFKFHPGINSIIGPSDNGKSVALRALRWIIENKSPGVPFLSHWEKNEKGVLTGKGFAQLSTDTHKIKRKRSTEFNGYMVMNNETGKKDKYEAIRAGVPDDLVKLFNMSDVNTQWQLDPPFMQPPAWTPGKVAEFFNKIVKLESIDKAFKSIAAKKKQNKTNISMASQQLTEAEESLENLNWLPRLERKIDKLEKAEQDLASATAEASVMRELADEYRALRGSIVKKYNPLIELEGKIEALEANTADLKVVVEAKEGLSTSMDEFLLLRKRVTAQQPYIDLDSAGLIPKLEKVMARLNNVQEQKKVLKQSVDSYNKVYKEVTEAGEDIKELEAQLPETCPTCGSKL